MDALKIPAVTKPLDAVVDVPGSKSITNRALLVAALAEGESIISDALFSEDTSLFSTCQRRLGIAVDEDQDRARFRVIGRGGALPATQADLFVGLSGTTARFVAAQAALGAGRYRMDGIPRMRERPMGDLLDALQRQGARVAYEGQAGYMPFVLHGRGLEGGDIRMKADRTSQQLSALLMVAPYARRDTTITVDGALVSPSYIAITRRVMADFGVAVDQPDARTFAIEAGQRYQARAYTVEPDASNASYFFAAAAITGGRVRVNGVSAHSCQGDIRFLQALESMDCRVHATDSYTEVVGPRQLRGVDVDMNDISDTMQTLAAIAPCADAPVTIRNIEHVRWKETDRIKAVATELARLGVAVEEFRDGLRIYPGPVKPVAVDTYNDHRMAMAFAVLGLKVAGIEIRDPDCTAKTFPDFFARLSRLAAGAYIPPPALS